MTFFNVFKTPYLNDDDGFDLGGGDTPIDNDDMTPEPEPETPKEQAEPVEDTKPTEPAQEQPKIKVKYNHEEKELSLDEATPLIQKGMNYDKLQEKFNTIQNDPALSKYGKVKEVSELLGYQSDDELLNALYDTYYQRTAETKGLTPEQIKKEHELSAKEKAVNQKEQTLSQKEKSAQMYANFVNNFPDVKTEMISQETWDKVDKGMDLTAAYTQQVNKELQEQIKILKQNEQNYKKAPISGVSKHGSEPAVKDSFLEGFDED